jgi:hypothetical protein
VLATFSAKATTLTFDDLHGAGAMPAGYAGLTWDPQWNYYDAPQPPYNPSSGATRLYTHNFGGWIKFGSDVTFNGSWVASSNAGQQMYWEGYQDGVKLFESIHLAGGAQQYINVNWAGVDEVRFVSTAYDFFIIDDLSFTTSVPDSAPTALLFGLAGCIVIAWRRSASRIDNRVAR